MQKGTVNQTGYPHIDKPWEKHYIQERLLKTYQPKTLYREIVDNNKDYLSQSAVTFLGGRFTYGQVIDNFDATAKSLEEYGVKKGQYVSAFVAGIPEALYLIYGNSKIGAVTHLIPVYETEDQLIRSINESGSELFFIMSSFYNEKTKNAIKKTCVKETIVIPTLNSSPLNKIVKMKSFLKNPVSLFTKKDRHIDWNTFIKNGKHRKDAIECSYEPNQGTIVFNTSGSTNGTPQGVLHTAESLNHKAHSYYPTGINLDRGMVYYSVIPPWFSTGMSTSYHLPMVYGAELFLDPRFTREAFVQNLLKYNINYTVTSLALYEGFLDRELVKKHYHPQKRNLKKLYYPFTGGEPANAANIRNIQASMEEVGFEMKLLNGYGSSENGPGIATQTPEVFTPGSSGMPLPGINIKIVDGITRKPLKTGELGELLVHNPETTMQKYFPKDKKKTENYFETDSDGIVWNKMGDAGYFDENGELYVLGRADDYTLVNGKRCYNFEVARIISEDQDIESFYVHTRKNGTEEKMVVHIVFSETGKQKQESDPKYTEQMLKRLQKMVLDVKDDADWMPEIFKVRKDFPMHTNGKRNLEKVRNETDGFTHLSKEKVERR